MTPVETNKRIKERLKKDARKSEMRREENEREFETDVAQESNRNRRFS